MALLKSGATPLRQHKTPPGRHTARLRDRRTNKWRSSETRGTTCLTPTGTHSLRWHGAVLYWLTGAIDVAHL
eukprot:11164113-Lingulodinium_polyedra.AAC.1